MRDSEVGEVSGGRGAGGGMTEAALDAECCDALAALRDGVLG